MSIAKTQYSSHDDQDKLNTTVLAAMAAAVVENSAISKDGREFIKLSEDDEQQKKLSFAALIDSQSGLVWYPIFTNKTPIYTKRDIAT